MTFDAHISPSHAPRFVGGPTSGVEFAQRVPMRSAGRTPTVAWSASSPRPTSSSWTSRNEREYRSHPWAAQRMTSGAKCRHMEIEGPCGSIMVSLEWRTALSYCSTTEDAITAPVDPVNSLALKCERDSDIKWVLVHQRPEVRFEPRR